MQADEPEPLGEPNPLEGLGAVPESTDAPNTPEVPPTPVPEEDNPPDTPSRTRAELDQPSCPNA